MRSPNKSPLLSRPIPMADGRFLRTLDQARKLTAEHSTGRFRCPWTRALPLVEAAETGDRDAIERLTGQIEAVAFGAKMLKL